MLVKTAHALDYRFVIAFVAWLIATVWMDDYIVTALHSVAVAVIRAATYSSLLGF